MPKELCVYCRRCRNVWISCKCRNPEFYAVESGNGYTEKVVPEYA